MDPPLTKPKAPEKPLMPYMKYTKLVYDEVKAKHPEMKIWESSKIIGAMWRELDEVEKQKMNDEYERGKVKYAEALKIYQKSEAYIAWMAQQQAQEAAKQAREAAKQAPPLTPAEKVDPSAAANTAAQTPKATKAKTASTSVRRLPAKLQNRAVLSQVGNEPAISENSQNSQKRFDKANHCISNIFNPYVADVVPMTEEMLESRLDRLKEYSEQTILFTNKVNQEIQLIEETFNDRKRRYEENNQKLTSRVEKNKKLADDHFQKLVQEELERIQKAAEKLQPAQTVKLTSQNGSVHNPDSLDIQNEDSADTEIDYDENTETD